MHTFHVITAVHNRYAVTERFIETLLSQTYVPLHLILVDDGSTDGTADMVKAHIPSASVITGNGNLWWGGALHKAYLYVKEELADFPDDYIMISNDDVTLPRDYLAVAAALLDAHPRTLIAGCGYGKRTGLLLDGAVERDFSNAPDAPYVPAFEGGDVCSSRSLLFRVSDFLTVGGFHPILLPHYASDYEWTYRAHRKGFAIRMFKSLAYTFDDESTGDNFYDTLTLKKAFGKRSAANPVYKLNYLLLTTPILKLPGRLCYQLRRYLAKKDVLKNIARRK